MRMQNVWLVARRELTERITERSFLISTGVTIAIIAIAVVLPAVLGFDEGDTFKVAAADQQSRAIVTAADRAADGYDAKITPSDLSPAEAARKLKDEDIDAYVQDGRLIARKKPDDKLAAILQSANRSVRSSDALRKAGLSQAQLQAALAPAPLRVQVTEGASDRQEELGGVAFFTVLLLYGQLLTYGFWVATGVVEEKSSRVIEILLAAIRPRELLAGKVIGLGLLGLGQLLGIAAIGVGIASATGAVDVDSSLLGAVALSLAWFVLGYAFYSCAFACAGALVPRQEELQATSTPLTMLILISLFIAFAVNSNPDGTLAHVTAFIPTTAPMTLPPRILFGEAPAIEIVGGAVVTIAAACLLIPLAARIYEGAVLRTGSSVKLRQAWRMARS
jgi:ABC-2 type transport system permease protein